MPKFQVASQKCAECLYSPNRIVSIERFKEILAELELRDCHFVCHKATIKGLSVCCRGDFDSPRGGGKLGRMAKYFKQFVETAL